MFYADIRGHHGMRWDYEPGQHYMRGSKNKRKLQKEVLYYVRIERLS